jgi:hypothetical protein
MQHAHRLFGVLLCALPIAFIACGDDEDDGGGGRGGSSGGGKGGKGGTAGSITGGTSTGGKGGTTGATGGTNAGRGGTSTGGDAGASGAGGEDGGQGGEGGEAGEAGQGGSGGAGMGGVAGTTAGVGGGGMAGGGMAGGGMAGGGMAGGGMAGGGMAGGGMAGGGMAGSGGTAPTCDPVDPPAIFVTVLEGSQEVPPVATTATGIAIAELNAAEDQLTTSVYWSGLTTPTHLGHIHGPAPAGTPAGVIFNLDPPLGATSGQVVAWTGAINPTQVGYLKAGQLYVNIHSTMFMSGEVRGQLLPATVLRTATLQGSQETPPVASSGTGRAVVAVFPNNTQAAVSVTWSGMTTPTHLGHIHGPAPAGTPAGVLFNLDPPLGATSGSVVQKIWDMTTPHSTALLGNLTYANIHSTMFMSGELRGQLLPPCP